MPDEDFDDVVRQLHDGDWRVRLAIRKLLRFEDRAAEQVSRLFDLTFDEIAATRSDSEAAIRRLGARAAPFLLERLESGEPRHREQAIDLLTVCGSRRGWPWKLVEQILPERNPELPDWGCDPETVIERFRERLDDPDLRVRFASASALEEFARHVPSTVPIFIEVLRDGADHGWNWSALRLGRIGAGARDACAALRQVANSEDRYASLAARNALDRIGCP